MNPFVKKILSSVGLTAVICIVALAWNGAVIYGVLYAQSPKESASVAGDFYDQVKKEMGDNPNNDNLSLFQAMQKVMEQKRLEAKNKITDPNDPRNDPRLKYYFGHSLEMSPVPAVINYGGLTMKVQANELISSTLDASPISGRQTTQLSFRFEYPEMTGRTPDNIDDFLVPIITNKKRIWLDINTEPACFDEKNVEVLPDDTKAISDYFSKLDTRYREFIVKNKGCPARRSLDIDYSVYGYNNSWYPHGWKKPSIYADLSEYYKMKNLNLDGYRMSCLSGDGECVLDERVYKYIPPNAKAGEYEFITCYSDFKTMSKKFPQIKFRKETAYASCTHYFLLKNRMIMQINYAEKYFKQNWQDIRNKVVTFFDNRISKVDDFVPLLYTKTKHGYHPVSQKQIDDFIKQNPYQKTN